MRRPHVLQRFDPAVPNSGPDTAPTGPSAALEFLRRFAEESLASIGDAGIVADPSGRILAMNSVAEVLTGWSENAASGRASGSTGFTRS